MGIQFKNSQKEGHSQNKQSNFSHTKNARNERARRKAVNKDNDHIFETKGNVNIDYY